MFILTTKSSPLLCSSLSCLKSSSFTVYKKCRLLTLAVFLILFTYTARTANCYINIPDNVTNSVPGEIIPEKTLARANSFIPNPGEQILFKRSDTCFGSISVSNSLVDDQAYSIDKINKYLTFVRYKKSKFVLNPIVELKISFSHPQYQHLSDKFISR